MDNEKLDRIVLLLEHMDKDFTARFEKLEQGQQEIKQHLNKHDRQLAALAEAINTTNQSLTSKIDTLDRKIDILEGQTNVNSLDIVKLRAAK